MQLSAAVISVILALGYRAAATDAQDVRRINYTISMTPIIEEESKRSTKYELFVIVLLTLFGFILVCISLNNQLQWIPDPISTHAVRQQYFATIVVPFLAGVFCFVLGWIQVSRMGTSPSDSEPD